MTHRGWTTKTMLCYFLSPLGTTVARNDIHSTCILNKQKPTKNPSRMPHFHICTNSSVGSRILQEWGDDIASVVCLDLHRASENYYVVCTVAQWARNVVVHTHWLFSYMSLRLLIWYVRMQCSYIMPNIQIADIILHYICHSAGKGLYCDGRRVVE